MNTTPPSNVFVRLLAHTMKEISHDQGQPLPPEVAQKMQAKLGGADLSDVRVHKNNKNVENIGASAFTQGKDIHFAPGKYDPNSPSGMKLLAHELAHVIQQKSGK